MEASSRDQVPVVPPRIFPPTIPPRVNAPTQCLQSRRMTSRNNNNRLSMDITHQNTPMVHERSNSDTSTGSVPASTADNIYSCPLHDTTPCSTVCTNCVELLCDKCVEQDDHKHKDCTLSYVGDSVASMCEQVKSSLTRKTRMTKHCVRELSGTLTRKKDRMISKKDETIAEIDRFYRRLKSKLLAKLQREENELFTYLQTTVAEQARSLSENIQQCSKIVHDLEQRGAMLDNLDKVYGANGNVPAHLKSLLRTAVDVNKDSGHINEITAARDAFLVIRFIANPEAEQAVINTKIATVEVLDSRSSSPDRQNIESEHINDVFANTGAESSGSVESIPSIHNCEQAPTSSASDHQIVLGDSSVTEVSTSHNVEETVEDNSSSSSVISNSERIIDNHGLDSSQHTSERINTEDNDDSDDDPPPPYPGLPSHSRSHNESQIPEEDPPPYPGPPPPIYVQLPEPQQPNSPSTPSNMPPPYRQRLGAISDTRPSPSRASPTSPRQTPASFPLPTPTDSPESAFPIESRPRGPLKTFSISEISDKRSSGIFSIAVYNANAFLVVDRWNRKLKYFNDQGESLGGVIFREEPWDVTKMTSEIFAVTVPKLLTIFKVKVTAQSVVTIGEITTTKRYACIDYHQTSELFVCGQVPQLGEPIVDVIGKTGGPILLSFRSDTLGQDLFSYPRYLKVANDGTVVVCDWNLKSLLIFKLDGTVVGRYKGSQEYLLNDPMGIELDKQTNKLYVIDSKQTNSCGTIQRVSLDCQCEEVYRGQKDFRDARAVSVYGQNRMAVGSKNGILSIFSTRARYR